MVTGFQANWMSLLNIAAFLSTGRKAKKSKQNEKWKKI